MAFKSSCLVMQLIRSIEPSNINFADELGTSKLEGTDQHFSITLLAFTPWIHTHISFKSRLLSRRGKSISICFFFICVRAYFFATIRKRLIFIWDDNTIDNSGFAIWTVTLLPIETPRGVARFITDLGITGCRGNRHGGKRRIWEVRVVLL